MKDIGLSNEYIELIRDILRNNSEINKAVIFGSRAKGNYRHNSDIDLALFGDLSLMLTESIRNDLEQLPMPYKFDVIAYDLIQNTDIKEHIDRVGIIIHPPMP